MIQEYFLLNDSYQDELRLLKPEFGYDGFGEVVYYRTYSRRKPRNEHESVLGQEHWTSQENWADTVIRVVNGTFTIRKDWYLKNGIKWDEDWWQEYANGFAKSMFNMYWLPPGRGLWAMGTEFVYSRGSMALNNCFSGNTKFLTPDGLIKFKDNVDQNVVVYTQDGWKDAVVKCFGQQKIQQYCFKLSKGRGKHKIKYNATRNHRWILSNGNTTDYIKIGDKVTTTSCDLINRDLDYENGFVHGLIYADGTKHTYYPKRQFIRLCGEKNKYTNNLEKHQDYLSTTSPQSFNGDNVITLISEIDFKNEPSNETSLSYKLGFLEAWISCDGHKNKNADIRLDTVNTQGINWLKEYSTILGYTIIGYSITNNDTNYGKRKNPLNRLTLRTESIEFVLESIVDFNSELENVYCIIEPETHSFMLEGGIITGNCGYTELGNTDSLSTDFEWMMDALMMGVGVGFHSIRDDLKAYKPESQYTFIIQDTRESWAHSVKLLIDAYLHVGGKFPKFDYTLIRPKGQLIKGFGGLSSGPEPLIKLHGQIVKCFDRYINTFSYDVVQLKTDIANMIGCCVVAGNVRRSAELALGSVQDKVFMDLKDYAAYPDRVSFGWMSNNTVFCQHDSDFDQLGEVAKRVPLRGEPGIANLRNFVTGRVGKKNKGLRKDKGKGLNPCAEVILENKELCNLSETSPTRCPDVETWYKACEYASFYSSTTSLLPTHSAATNEIVARNRRIGVGLIDYTGWIRNEGLFKVTRYMRRGYKIIRATNQWANGQAGVPEAVRVTVIKPGGTVPKLVGKTAGAGYPTFPFIIRRMRIADNNPIIDLLKEANIPFEEDIFDKHTLVFEFPVKQTGSKAAEFVSLWEQANNLVTLQREWSDNSVSNTLYFKPKWILFIDTYDLDEIEEWLTIYPQSTDKVNVVKSMDITGNIINLKLFNFNPNHEEDDIEPVLSSILPVIKACSLLPHSYKGVYRQMPEEGITEEEYLNRLATISPINWSEFSGSDGEDEKYCQGGLCEVPI